MTIASIMTSLLGGEDPGEGTVLRHASLRFGNDDWLLWLVIFAAASGLVAWLAYRRSPIKPSHSSLLLLTALRAAFLTLLGAAFLQPVLRLTESRKVTRVLPIALDHSQSFGLRDIGADKTRLDTGKQILDTLTSSLANDLDLATYRFGGDVERLDENSEIVADASSTAMGDAVESILSIHSGQPLAGLVLLTDGNSNDGRLLESSEHPDAPLYIVGVGAEDTADVSLEEMRVPHTVLAEDQVPVELAFEAQGLENETGNVILTVDGVETSRQAIRFTAGLNTAQLEFLPLRPGTHNLEARVETAAEELLATNNAIRERIDVVDSRLRVLLIEQAPRWEFKYLQAMLLREPRVALACLLLEAEVDAEREPGSPYLPAMPRREELLDYDLVILGDVDPDLLPDALQNHILEHVGQTGGALVILAGKRFMPTAYRYESIASLFPVIVEQADFGTKPASQPITLQPRDTVPMLVLADDPGRNDELWRDLPPIYWKAAVSSAKPGALVCLQTAIGEPVAVLQRYGSGEVFFLGTDNAWRWRREAGDRLHTRFWGQIVQRLAGARLVEGSRRTTIETDKRRYRPGEPIAIRATLFSPDWRPFDQESLIATLEDESGGQREVLLRRVPDQPGAYSGQTPAGPSGSYHLRLPESPDVRPVSLTVEERSEEFAALTVDRERLRRLAESTGGRFFTPETVSDLPAAVRNRDARVLRNREIALWSSPLYFVILLVSLTFEWVLRKFCELK